MTKHPDTLKAQEHGLKVLECGGSFSAAKLSRAAAPKQNDWGGFKQAKVCLLAIGCQQSKLAKTAVLRSWLLMALF